MFKKGLYGQQHKCRQDRDCWCRHKSSLAQSKPACITLRPSSSLLTSVTNVIILCPVLLMRNWSQTFISGFMPSLVLTRSSRFMVYHRFAYKLQRASCASLGRIKQDAEGASSLAAVVPISATGPQPGEASSKTHGGDCHFSQTV